MRKFTDVRLYASFIILTSHLAISEFNSISKPTAGEVLVAGTTYTIEWKPDIGSTVELQLWDDTYYGYSRAFGDLCYNYLFNPFCGQIATNVSNTGKYEWHIPHQSDYPRNQPYFWLKMFVNDFYHPELGNTDPVLSYSQNFSFTAEPYMSASSLSLVTASSTNSVILPGPATSTIGALSTPHSSPPSTPLVALSSTSEISTADAASEPLATQAVSTSSFTTDTDVSSQITASGLGTTTNAAKSSSTTSQSDSAATTT
ncbi:uncharacterized protein BDZ99DRAFT_565845 [Mytilinidion resinicola]|uniref:Uncharacterized protein n=1 Tax=Mytilinidion resinicola TaxID=574789 RepID=A0A6A6Z5E0_9PEZI|nr:uncharacterized protein BDZ99DRAFT_565845 [Mytilinidion resinicola]KAF2815949.1 hypothetical protein BDZ99DRAFT_565845 [Mytilinidion resinicola]